MNKVQVPRGGLHFDSGDLMLIDAVLRHLHTVDWAIGHSFLSWWHYYLRESSCR